MTIKNPCKVCEKAVAKTHDAIQCDVCNIWVHRDCNKINKQTYKLLQRCDASWFCLICTEENLPFNKIGDEDFAQTIKGKKVKFVAITKPNTGYQAKIIDDLNNAMDNFDDDVEKFQSKYYTPDEFNIILNDIKNENLNIFHQNISSLSLHLNELITILINYEQTFDILGITETRIRKQSFPINNIDLEGYNYEQTKTESKCGGTLLYIKKGIDYKLRTDLEIYKSKELESIFIEILNKNSKNTIIGCIYKHPNMETSEFNELFLEKTLNKITKENKKVVLMGDFNINILKYDTDTTVSDFMDIMYSNTLLPYITGPTHITPTSSTLIDNIFYNGIDENVLSGNIITSLSDHLGQFLIIPNNEIHVKKKKNIYARNYKNIDTDALLLDLKRINWENVLKPYEGNIENTFQNFFNAIENLLDVYAPYKQLSQKELKLREKPWITKGILKAIKNKNKIQKRVLRTKDLQQKEYYHNIFKKYRNQINKLCRISKSQYYKDYFNNNKQNLQKTWDGIKQILNTENKSKKQVSYIKENDKFITDHVDLANSFNKYFCSIAKKIESNLRISNHDFKEYLGEPTLDSFFINPTTPEELECEIKSLKNNKSPGPFSINTKLLKLFKKEFSHPMSILTNMSFQTGTFPSHLKIANVVPIHKKDDKIILGNYRPISLLSNIGKIIEKLMHKRLHQFLDKHNIIHNLQFGFRFNHSTEHALISITEKIRDALDSGNIACGVFIDLKKAFDTVNHEILLKKLLHFGVRGLAYNWFSSYLSNRKQYVTIETSKSCEETVKYGVPQGSVLGPLLFIIYINDLKNAIKYSSVHQYADDTNLMFADKSVKKINKYINHDLKLLSEWLIANRISLNTDKTEIIIFKNKNKKINKKLNFRISGQKIKPTNAVKYLGVILEENLSWDKHLNILNKRLGCAIGILTKLRHYVPKMLLRTVYYSLFNSHLIYGCQIWGNNNSILLSKTKKLQEKALKIMDFSNNDKTINEVFYDFKILKFEDFLKYRNITFIKDCLNKIGPKAFYKDFTLCQERHHHYTRNAHKNFINIPQVQTSFYGINSIKYKSATTWNNMQNALQSDLLTNSYPLCKKLIFDFYLKSYCQNNNSSYLN